MTEFPRPCRGCGQEDIWPYLFKGEPLEGYFCPRCAEFRGFELRLVDARRKLTDHVIRRCGMTFPDPEARDRHVLSLVARGSRLTGINALHRSARSDLNLAVLLRVYEEALTARTEAYTRLFLGPGSGGVIYGEFERRFFVLSTVSTTHG